MRWTGKVIEGKEQVRSRADSERKGWLFEANRSGKRSRAVWYMSAARCQPPLPLNGKAGRFAAYSASHGGAHTVGYLVRLLWDLNVDTGN